MSSPSSPPRLRPRPSPSPPPPLLPLTLPPPSPSAGTASTTAEATALTPHRTRATPGTIATSSIAMTRCSDNRRACTREEETHGWRQAGPEVTGARHAGAARRCAGAPGRRLRRPLSVDPCGGHHHSRRRRAGRPPPRGTAPCTACTLHRVSPPAPPAPPASLVTPDTPGTLATPDTP